MKSLVYLLGFIFSLSAFASEPIVLEEYGKKIKRVEPIPAGVPGQPAARNPSKNNRSSRWGTTRTVQKADNGFDFRRNRKVGLGVVGAGALGLGGVQLELNLSREFTFIGGYGGSTDFQAFKIEVKRIVGGKSFLPYIGAGFARWYRTTNSGQISSTSPGFLESKFLDVEEKRNGVFEESLIYPTLGLQYVQLDGSWAGTSFFAHVVVLTDVDDFVTAPTGEVGMTYFF